MIERSTAVSFFMLISFGLTTNGWGQETRPALLEIEELGQKTYALTWKLPVKDGAAPNIEPRLPEDCRASSKSSTQRYVDAWVSHSIVTCDRQALLGRRIAIEGLRDTILETFVVYRGLDSSTLNFLLSRAQPAVLLSPDGNANPEMDRYFIGGTAAYWTIGQTIGAFAPVFA